MQIKRLPNALICLQQHAGNQAVGRMLTSAPAGERIQRLVEGGQVSCESYPRTYPIFTTIGTSDPLGVIEQANRDAIVLLDNVIGELSHIRARVLAGEPPAWPLISSVISMGMRYRLRLNPSDPAVWTGTGRGTIEMIVRWFSNIRRLLDGPAIDYTCLGPLCFAYPAAGGYSFPGVTNIYLCRKFWDDRYAGDRPYTLIHEALHIHYGLGDWGGGTGNVCCLEQFIADANVHHPVTTCTCTLPPP